LKSVKKITKNYIKLRFKPACNFWFFSTSVRTSTTRSISPGWLSTTCVTSSASPTSRRCRTSSAPCTATPPPAASSSRPSSHAATTSARWDDTHLAPPPFHRPSNYPFPPYLVQVARYVSLLKTFPILFIYLSAIISPSALLLSSFFFLPS